MIFGTHTKMRVLCCIVALSSTLSGAPQENQRTACLRYEPTVVTLRGTLVRKTFPGPPGYESIAQGDRPETYWILHLSQPLCVEQDKEEPRLNPEQKNIRAVQLVVDPNLYEKQKGLIGKAVIVTGTLFGSHTGHHHTAVLLNVRAIASSAVPLPVQAPRWFKPRAVQQRFCVAVPSMEIQRECRCGALLCPSSPFRW
jgi:uncharacterized protein DUF4431